MSRRRLKAQVIEEIYEMYSRKVFLFLLSKTNNVDIAEELTQETFFQAVQCIDRFKGNSSILTWLCGIAKNVWLKDLRKRQETLSIDDDIPEITDTQKMNVQWEQKEILQLIHDMNEPVREVMYLRLISNLSFAEIGEIIGKTENWTRVTFFRGKQKIVKEMLKDE
jgi:RNA polymerase sigma factor (sigma-70 family)